MLFWCIECYHRVANQLLTVTIFEDALEKFVIKLLTGPIDDVMQLQELGRLCMMSKVEER
jgi:hypothetical protein